MFWGGHAEIEWTVRGGLNMDVWEATVQLWGGIQAVSGLFSGRDFSEEDFKAAAYLAGELFL